MASVRILPGNQAAAWGHQSAGGVILLDSLPPDTEIHQAQLSIGSFETIAADTQHCFSAGRHGLFIHLAASQSEGDFLIHPDDRGSIDGTAEFETRGIDARHHYQISEAIRLQSSISYYDEDRNNGTPATHYNTGALDLSLRVLGNIADQEWSASIYYQNRSLESLFSSVNASRTAETPTLDQFDIPADGIGGNLVIATEDFEQVRVVVGADVRHLIGETNEDVLIPNRRRIAGGEQTLSGFFLKLANKPAQANTYELSLRMDHWSLRDGSRVEAANATGTVSLNEDYRDRDDWEPSVSFAAARQMTESLRLNVGSGYTFRLPTINELYRPFRVGSDLTEANPELSPERFLNLEAALAWEPCEFLKFESGVFHYWIDDAIANVGSAAPAGVFVPAGGSYNQKQNVESSTVFGWQTRVEYTPTDTLSLALDYLYTSAEFDDSTLLALEGKRFPQVPSHKATASIDYQISAALMLFGSVEYGSAQYDDPLNTRKLASFITGQLGASYQVSDALRFTGRVDNIADAIVITGERSNGVRSIAPGRSFWLSVLVDF